MKKLLTMCSSHRRPWALRRMLDSWAMTVQGDCSKMAVYIDEQNPFYEAYKAIIPPRNAVIEFGPYKTMVQVCNHLSCERYRDFDYYSEVNDDHVFVTKGWDVKMIDAIDRKNMAVAVAYGITRNMPTATMHSALLVRELGYFFPPEYRHSWVDNWLVTLGYKTNILTHLNDVLIEHMHPAFGKADKDDTYRAVEGDYANGRLAFEKWQKEEMDKDVLKINNLITRLRVVGQRTLPRIAGEELSVMMVTHQRTDLLERAVRSYLKTDPRPPRLYVFDDASPAIEKIKALVLRIPEVVFIQDDEHEGCGRRILKSFRAMFETGAKNILTLDPDCVFAMNWWAKAQTLPYKDHLCGLFNAKVHRPLSEPGNGIVQKRDIGGLGMILTKETWAKYLEPMVIEKHERINWDGRLCRLWEADGKKMFACSPSMVQHTGMQQGLHCNPDIVADDFVGEAAYSDFEMAHPFKLRYLGESPYRGFDNNGNVEVNVNYMGFVQLSREKARQVLTDMPSLWVYISCVTEDSLW